MTDMFEFRGYYIYPLLLFSKGDVMKMRMRQVHERFSVSIDQAYNTRLMMLAFLIAAIVCCRDVQAAITGVTGDVSLIAPPISVEHDALTSDTTIFGFEEVQNITLNSDLLINGSGAGVHGSGADYTIGYIPSGTNVNSFFFHADPYENSLVRYLGSISFDSVILGIVFLHSELHLSDLSLGLAGTSYLDHVYRDFEVGSDCAESVADCATISEDLKTITLDFGATIYYDQIRVITAVVPEPGTALLAGLGVVGLLATFRRKRSSMYRKMFDVEILSPIQCRRPEQACAVPAFNGTHAGTA